MYKSNGRSARTSLGALGIGLWFATSAHAQSVGQVPGPSDVGESARPDDFQVEDVIVTAQRRSERARDVPISLTVANAATLERAGVTNVRDVQLITPGLRIDRFGPSVQPAIRGITSRDSSPGNDPNIALYVDGVYQPVQTANNFEFPDVERIEVAKGPQGTLFGRNATGGAIQIFTKRPSYDVAGSLGASYGRFNDRLVKGYANVPLVDGKAAFSIVASYQKSDGYIRNIEPGGREYGELDSRLIRAKLLLEPTEWLSFLATAGYSRRDDDTGVSGTPLNGNSAGRTVPGTLVPNAPYEVALQSAFNITRSKNVNLKTEADLGVATLTSITAYDKSHLGSLTESDGATGDFSNNINTVDYKTFSEEVTLTSRDGGAFNWTLGAFYYFNDSGHNPNTSQSRGVFTSRTFAFQKTNAYAAFGEASLKLTDDLKVIAGVRYSHERRELTGHRDLAVANTFPTQAPDALIGELSFDSVTPRLSLLYAASPDTNLYFTYSQGFKSGGFSTLSLSTTSFNPEKVKAYEVGVKSAPSRSFSVNAAAFYYDYRDLQVQTTVVGPTGAQINITNNAATSEIYGAEADAVLRATPELTFNLAVSLLHARYKDFKNALVQTPRLIGGVPCLCGNVTVLIDASGNPLIRSPNYTVSAGANYRRDISAGAVEVSGLLYYSDKFNFQPDSRVQQSSYAMLNGRASFEPNGRNVKFSIWGKNLTNTKVYAGATISTLADQVIYAQPRTYGVQLDYTF